jgi:hypothetical protein
MADGFLGRWSQRKQALREGRELDESPAVRPESMDAKPHSIPKAPTGATAVDVTPHQLEQAAVEATPPPPTLADVNALNSDSSFAPFVSRDVAPDVRNAAMKKLFTDPHYNVMDGLDIYIDDYSKPDPLPAAMLRQLASAKFLNLLEEEETPPPSAPATPSPPQRDVNPVTVASDSAGEPVPVLSDTPAAAIPQTPTDTLPAPSAAGLPAQEPHHDHTDLRLQPNDAAGRPQSERIAE